MVCEANITYRATYWTGEHHQLPKLLSGLKEEPFERLARWALLVL